MGAPKPIGLWRLWKVTGLWSLERMCDPRCAKEWLAIWKRDKPGETFRLSVKKPANPFLKRAK